MNIFTNDDYRRIQAWLKANAIKDSDFTISENTVPDEDILVITQNVSTIPTNYRIKIKDLLNSSLGKIVIDKITANVVKVNNTLIVDAANIKLDNEKGTTLQDIIDWSETVEKAAKGWNIEYQVPSIDEPTVRAKYVLKDSKGVPKGDVIKVYKDSAITNVYLGTTKDTCNENTGEVTKEPVQNNNEALSIVYRLDTGKYSLVNVPIGIFTREAEFDKYRGLGVTENGQVFVKLASDVESSNYLHFNDMGEVSADGIENRILQDLGTIINSVANDGTMWGQYKKEEGTKDSPINEASRWGQYKQAEADRSELLNIVSSKVNQLEQEQIQGGVYDVSIHNDRAVFESLQALLSSPNLSTLIPISVRHGGMSIRFIQGSVPNSDNKYVQYRLTTNEWSTNTEDWSFCGNDVYVDNPEFIRVVLDNKGKILEAIRGNGTKLLSAGVEINKKIDFEDNKITIIENPEFVYVKTDNEGKILWAIKVDGSIYYGAGVPPQIIDYINEKIAELSLDEYEDIVAFLNNLEEGDKTLQTLLNEKVDKEEGKSLIDNEYASTKSTIDNPEFLEVVTDTEDKVLEGIKSDGTKILGVDLNVGGSAKILGNMEISGVSYKVVENHEFLAIWVDGEDKVIFGIKTDGKTYVGDADFLNDIDNIKNFLQNITDKNIDWDALSSITTVENSEYIEAKTDSEGKLLAGRTSDGAVFENVGFSTPKVSIDGAIIENIKDPEGRREVTTDAEGKIISYRDSEGVKHEEAGIKLSEKGLSDLEKDLKTLGVGVMNWSDIKELHISEPKCAIVNFTSISAMPTSKTDDYKAYMQFWDMNGNYFKKEVIMNAQGSSSLAHPKKNISIDICNNNGWDDDDTFKFQVGSWVPQDSFHLKSFYMDAFRGLCPVAYKLYDQIVKTRGELNDYVWKRAFINFDSITSTSNGSSTTNDTKAKYNDGAKCFPDGFPCIVYLNGEFYGIYSWQLKKHRDNYHMKKNNAKHVHLDGILNDTTIWGDSVNWTAFEIRNPKGLKTVDGGKYDGDNPTEITGDSNVDAITAEVRGYIENFHTIKETIVNAYAVYNASSKTEEDKNTFKQIFETYLDSMNLIDYIIFSDVSNNYDGFNKNWQWFTYDGVKWYCGVYDADGVFGGYYALDNTIVPPLTSHLTLERQSVAAIGATWMITPIYSVYKDELESRYAELRNLKVIDTNNIINLMINWLDRLGNKATFEKEWKKWPDFIKNDSIHRMYKWVVESINNMDSVYNYNQN